MPSKFPQACVGVCKFDIRACFLAGDAVGSLGVDLDRDRLVCVPVVRGEGEVRSRLDVALKMGVLLVRRSVVIYRDKLL